MLSFLRHSDGKLFERYLNDDEIQDLHQIFFDTTLILDVLENPPSSLNFVFVDPGINPPLYTETDSHTENAQNVRSEQIDVIWKFAQARAHGPSKKSKDYPVSIRIPEKYISAWFKSTNY